MHNNFVKDLCKKYSCLDKFKQIKLKIRLKYENIKEKKTWIIRGLLYFFIMRLYRFYYL